MMQFDFFERRNRYKFEISKIQDGGGRHLVKNQNRDISTTVQPIATKFGMVTQFNTYDAFHS